jgi:hypothetical protein
MYNALYDLPEMKHQMYNAFFDLSEMQFVECVDLLVSARVRVRF